MESSFIAQVQPIQDFRAHHDKFCYWLSGLSILVAGLFFPSVTLAEETQTLQEVTVTAKGEDVAERREAATQKVVMDRKEIENMGVMTVGEVLVKLPGVELGSGGMGQRARGMSRDSVQILVDGERSAGSGGFIGAIGRLPSGDLERVEILRGSSAEFGGAASVTVNLIMKKALPKNITEVRAGVGKRGSEFYNQLSWSKSGGEGGFSWSLPVTLMWSRAPVIRNIDRQDFAGATRTLWQQESDQGATKSGHHSIAPRMTWKNGGDSLTIAPMLFLGPPDTKTSTAMTKYNTPATGSGLAFNGDRVTRLTGDSRLLRLRVEGEKHLDDYKLTGRAAINNGKKSSDVVRDSHDSLNVLTSSTENTKSNENELNMALRLDKPFGGEHLLAVGLEHVNLRRTEDQVFSGTPSVYHAQERQSIAWVQDDWMVDPKVTFTYGLRGESIVLDSNGVAQQRGQVMPSLAVRWEPMAKWVMRSSLGAGLKMPKLDEISNAASFSISTNTPVEADKRGNPDLQPERSLNFEAVMERYLDGEAGLLGANIYVRSTQDFTERRVQQEGVRWVDRPYNEGRALHWGFELDGKVRTDNLGWKGATVKAHLTLPNARVNDARLGVKRMARDTPKYVLSAGLDESLPKLKSSYGISLQFSGRSSTDIPGELKAFTQAKTTMDAFWLYKLTPQFNLRLSGQNLLAADTVRETQFASAGNTWQLHTVEGGYRSVMATVEGRW